MQHLGAEIERLIREGTIDADTGFTYATNAGNLEMADFLEEQGCRCKPQEPKESNSEFGFTR